ncbi:MAG TPA: PAS domain S-box protein [Bryobacteraceae bacterium]
MNATTSRVRQADEPVRLVVEAAPYAMVATDPEGRIVLANAHVETLFGHFCADLLGQPVEFLAPELCKAHPSLRKDFIKDLRARFFEADDDLRGRRKDGSHFPVEIRWNQVHTAEGTWILASILDVSERKRVESQVRESEERFQNLADNSPVMIWMSGPDQLCTFFSRGWLEFTGREIERELGQGWTEGVHPEDLDRCLEIYQVSFDGHRNFQMEFRLRRSDGEYRRVLDTGIPLFSSAGVFSGYVGSCVDITEFKRAEEVAFGRQKLESLGLLASGLAHDFNNMQSGIIALSEILLDNPGLDAGVAEELRKIRKIALHGSEIVHELMVYAGEDEVDLGLVDISALIEEMRELLHVSISKRAILKTNLAKGLFPVLANATHVRQVLMNLVVNASEAIRESGGVIEVSTSRWKAGARHIASNGAANNGASWMDGDYVRLVVSDTGRGMTKQVQRKIFDPFFTTKVSGRGLGLAVVQGIVRRYGGALEVKSSPGKGTRFEILFPYAHQHAPQRAALNG